MGWKRRAALEKKEAALEELERAESGYEVVYTGPASLRPVDPEGEEITYDQLMALLFKDGEIGEFHGSDDDPAVARKERREQWKESRKKVSVDALFAPRASATR